MRRAVRRRIWLRLFGFIVLHCAVCGALADVHPLPLAAQWNVGAWPGSFDPDFQIELLREGRYLLPTFNLEPPDRPVRAAYYESAIRYLAREQLPVSFISLQWELMLPKISAAYAARDSAGRNVPLSPFGALEPWYAAGRRWAEHPMLKRLQRLYPDPPLVVFVSNNEYPKLAWHDLAQSAELRTRAGPNADDATIRRVVGDAWIERYRELIRGFREGLTQAAWRDHALFTGYDAFSQASIGRWPEWAQYSLHVPGRMEPWSSAWDGASVSFYVHDWAPDSDYTVWSPQIEAMNQVPVLADVMRARPAYWFELSVWDGQQPGSPTDKALFYRSRGQQMTPARFAGMSQFGMWLLRPRVVREFRGTMDDRARFGASFDATLAAVARVHDNPVLSRFWRTGRLLANPSNAHPYEEALPADYAGRARWFLLDSPANPPRPWRLDTPLEVFALALEAGESAGREWLVYAFSPRRAQMQVDVQIPDGPRVRVQATSSGCFSRVQRASAVVETLTCADREASARGRAHGPNAVDLR